MAETPVIQTNDLRKTYDGVEALRGLTMQVPRGSVTGFLGRNGAGKTTTIKVLLDIAHATSGEARVFDIPSSSDGSVEIRRRTGFVSEEKDLYPYMTVAEMVRFTAAFFPRWRRDQEERYLRKFDLPADRKVKALSKGMRSKLALLLALCRGAELLILDEPTSGLDPAGAEEVLRVLVSHVADDGTTIFFSSHQIPEIEQIADRLVMIDRGQMVLTGALDDIRDRHRRVSIVFDHDAPELKFKTGGISGLQRKGRAVTLLSSNGTDAIVSEARAFGAASVDVAPVSLKEIFLEVVNVEN